MPTNPQEFQANEEQKEFLDILTTTYFVLINNVTGLHPSQISMDDLSTKTFDNHIETYGYVIAKMHLYYDISPDYEPYTEFELFPTLGDAYNHFAEKIMLRDGLLTGE